VLVLLIFLFIAFGATAAGKWFRFYSIGTILTLLVFLYSGWHAGPAGCGEFADPMARNHGACQRLFRNVMGAGAWGCPLAQSNCAYQVAINLDGEHILILKTREQLHPCDFRLLAGRPEQPDRLQSYPCTVSLRVKVLRFGCG
jgi:hypothetical protein